jgi:hypothetical protein
VLPARSPSRRALRQRRLGGAIEVALALRGQLEAIRLRIVGRRREGKQGRVGRFRVQALGPAVWLELFLPSLVRILTAAEPDGMMPPMGGIADGAPGEPPEPPGVRGGCD